MLNIVKIIGKNAKEREIFLQGEGNNRLSKPKKKRKERKWENRLYVHIATE